MQLAKWLLTRSVQRTMHSMLFVQRNAPVSKIAQCPVQTAQLHVQFYFHAALSVNSNIAIENLFIYIFMQLCALRCYEIIVIVIIVIIVAIIIQHCAPRYYEMQATLFPFAPPRFQMSTS